MGLSTGTGNKDSAMGAFLAWKQWKKYKNQHSNSITI